MRLWSTTTVSNWKKPAKTANPSIGLPLRHKPPTNSPRPPVPAPRNAVMMQNAINLVARNRRSPTSVPQKRTKPPTLPFIQTPADFRLHAVPDTLGKESAYFRSVSNQQKLYLDADNHLRVGDADAAVPFAAQPVGEGPLHARIDLENPLERKTAEAALRAFAEVYGLELDLEDKLPQSTPDVVITDRIPAAPQPQPGTLVTDQAGTFSLPERGVFSRKTPAASVPAGSQRAATRMDGTATRGALGNSG